MCWYVQYLSKRCYHLVHKVSFCVGVCADLVAVNTHPSRYNRLGIIPRCPDPRTQTFMVNNYCYRCWHKDPRKNYLDPLDPRIVHMIEGDVRLGEWTWYVDEMPLNQDFAQNFREINWNPNETVVGEANHDKYPASPTASTPPPPIPRRSSLRISWLGKRKAPPDTPTPPNQPQTPESAPFQTDDFTPSSRPQRRLFTTIPPRHAPKLLIVPHTGRVTHLQTHTASPITNPSRNLALEASDPTLTASLASGNIARSSRYNLRAIRDSPAEPNKRAKTVAETRVRLESQGKSSSAGFKGGLRFKGARTRRAPMTEKGGAGATVGAGASGEGGVVWEADEELFTKEEEEDWEM